MNREALEEIKQLLQASLEATGDGILVVDNRGGIILSNRRFARMWRIPQKVVDQRDNLELRKFVMNQLADPEGYIARIEELHSLGGDATDVLVFKDGRIFERHSSPLLISGEVAGRVMSFRDITAYRDAQRSLERSEQKYRELVENANSIVIRIDTTGKITFINEYGQRLFGYSEEELIGQPVLGTIVALQSPVKWDLERMIENTADSTERHTYNENQNITKSGKTIWVSWSNKIVYNEKGQAVGILSVGTDISERKRLEIQQAEQAAAVSILYETLEEITRSSGSVESMCQHIADIIVNKLSVDKCAVWLLDRNASKLVRTAHSGPGIIEGLGAMSTEQKGLLPYAVNQGEHIYVPDVALNPHYRREDKNTRSEFVVLLKAREEVLGVINMESAVTEGFDEHTRRMVVAFAENAALALQNVELINALESSLADLEETQARFNFFLDHTTEGIYRVDIDPPISTDLPPLEQVKLDAERGRIGECNEAFARMYGFTSKQQVIGKPYIHMHGDRGHEQNLDSTLALIRSGYRINDLETTEYSENGETLYFLNNVIGIIRDGLWVASWGTQRDITSLKRAIEALRESEARLRTIIDQIPFDLWVCDSEGRYIMQNAVSVDLAGNLIGKTVEDLPVPEETKRIYRDRHRRARQGERIMEEIEAKIKSRFRTMESVLCPIRDGQRILGFIGLQLDITERKKAAEELKRHRDHLEDLVAERSRELQATQEELLRSERLSALGQAAATVAHEIRNPLGTVRSAMFTISEALARGDSQRILRARELAERNILRCDTIINDLLEYTREHKIHLEPTDIDSWIAEFLEEQILPEGILCTKDLQAGTEILLDREALRRVLTNVVGNAVDALTAARSQDSTDTTPEQRLCVATRLNENRLEIQVEDTGEGMSRDVLDRIFEPLYSTKNFGVGLGMSVVKDLMDRVDGGVEIRSTENLGTSVRLWLPLQQLDR